MLSLLAALALAQATVIEDRKMANQFMGQHVFFARRGLA
jgi:hypothetical protein